MVCKSLPEKLPKKAEIRTGKILTTNLHYLVIWLDPSDIYTFITLGQNKKIITRFTRRTYNLYFNSERNAIRMMKLWFKDLKRKDKYCWEIQ
jgi:hypothetical protein